jgi:hypothetical protein
MANNGGALRSRLNRVEHGRLSDSDRTGYDDSADAGARRQVLRYGLDLGVATDQPSHLSRTFEERMALCRYHQLRQLMRCSSPCTRFSFGDEVRINACGATDRA